MKFFRQLRKTMRKNRFALDFILFLLAAVGVYGIFTAEFPHPSIRISLIIIVAALALLMLLLTIYQTIRDMRQENGQEPLDVSDRP